MPNIPFWEDNPDAWDTVVLGPFTLPGICDFDVDNIDNDIDVKKPHGGDGATTTDRGSMPGRFTITSRIWDNAGLAAWATIAPSIRPLPGKAKRPPYQIVHPKAAFWNVSAVTIQGVQGPKRQGDGAMLVTLKCIEFLPAKGTATTTPTQSIPAFDNALTKPATKPTPPSATIPKP